MSTSDSGSNRSLDVLGIKPIGEAVRTLTDATVNGAASFLGRICLPAAEEFGLLLRDRVRAWRAANIASILEQAEAKLGDDTESQAHPRVVSNILEQGSWAHHTEVQEMWAGLLASACTADGEDESNLIFITLLSQISELQTRVLNYACQNANKRLAPNGLVICDDELKVSLNELAQITGVDDIHRIDREIDYLTNIGLLSLFGSGFSPHAEHLDATLCPSPLALHLYVRAQGSRESPDRYYNLELPIQSQNDNVPDENG